MLVVDFVIIGLTVGAAIWGYSRGVRTAALVLLGFAAGALLGSRLAPLALEGDMRDPFAPVLALPGALLFGALGAAALERLGFLLRRWLRGRDLLDGLGGALLAGCAGLVVVWILAVPAASTDGLKKPLKSSAVLTRLNAVLPAPGPLLSPEEASDPFPMIAGVKSGVGPPSQKIKTDPQVRAAARSVVQVEGVPCGTLGSGWIAGDGLVVTNAHVVRGNDQSTVKIKGEGDAYDAETIWYEPENDIAVMRVPGLVGRRALPVDLNPKRGTSAAALGFPLGGPYRVIPARVGRTARVPGFAVGGLEGDRSKQKVTTLRASTKPGNSGGPVVDGRGRVVAVVFAGSGGRDGSGGPETFGVPTEFVDRALKRAGAPVDTGECPDF